MKIQINVWFAQCTYILTISQIAASVESDGLGNQIEKQTWSEGLFVAKDTGKPFMVVWTNTGAQHVNLLNQSLKPAKL